MTAKQQIYDYLVQLIRSGAVKVGQQMPTEKEIAAEFSVSRSTVQNVMSRLVHEGIVNRYPGRGTFANRIDDSQRMGVNLDIHNIQSFESELAVAGDKVTYRLLSFSQVPVPPRAAGKLGIAPGTQVLALHRLRLVDGACIGSELRYFSPDIDFDVSTRALETQGAHVLIEEKLGIPIARIDAALRAVSASEAQAEAMGIEPAAPLLVRSHTLFDPEDKVILYGESSYVEPFSFQYSATVRR